MFPRLSSIIRPIDAIANGKIRAMQAFATSDINNVWIGGRDGNGSDRLRGFAVKNRCPCATIIVGLPHAAIDLPDIEDIWLVRHAARRARASPAKRTDHAPVHLLIRTLWILLSATDRCNGNATKRNKYADLETA